MPDSALTISQLAWARQHSIEAIALTEAACAADGVDRSAALADERRSLASFDRQIAELTPPAPKVVATKSPAPNPTES